MGVYVTRINTLHARTQVPCTQKSNGRFHRWSKRKKRTLHVGISINKVKHQAKSQQVALRLIAPANNLYRATHFGVQAKVHGARRASTVRVARSRTWVGSTTPSQCVTT